MINKIDSKAPSNFISTPTLGFWPPPCSLSFFVPESIKIKLPRQVIFIEALPRNAYGKVLKLELRDRLKNDRLRNLKSGIASESDAVTSERKKLS